MQLKAIILTAGKVTKQQHLLADRTSQLDSNVRSSISAHSTLNVTFFIDCLGAHELSNIHLLFTIHSWD